MKTSLKKCHNGEKIFGDQQKNICCAPGVVLQHVGAHLLRGGEHGGDAPGDVLLQEGAELGGHLPANQR